MTHFLVVVNDPDDWPLDVPGVQVVSADRYLSDPATFERPRTRVVNLCRSLKYQQGGYYVSLLAEARAHKPIPTVGALLELRSPAIVRAVSQDLEELIEKSLAPLGGDEFSLSIYFGRNVAKRYDALAAALYQSFRAPLMRATFKKSAKEGTWSMRAIDALDVTAVPDDHRVCVVDALRDVVSGRSPRPRRRQNRRYDLALLHDPSAEDEPASNQGAIKNFIRAGEAVGFAVRVIGKDDSSRLPEFDALFIRDTTQLNHYTHRFALKAKALGLVVIDDPEAIQKCMNKVFLAELLAKHKIPSPRSMVVTKRNAHEVEGRLGLPCVLKQPDSAFSQGVTKAETPEALEKGLQTLLKRSSLVIAQEYRPTEFDWRIGVLDGQPLYACRYYMASQHWQILRHKDGGGEPDAGRVETIPVETAPGPVLDIAVRAATLYGDGLFGVDVKVLNGQPVVIEVNDNPTIDAGDEDRVLGDELYLRIMRHIMSRVEQRKRAGRFR